MLKRATAHKTSINAFLIDRPIQSLTDNDWIKLTTVVGLLKPCAEATDQIGGEKYVSSSIILPHLAHLLYLNRPSDDDAAYVVRFKKAISEDITQRRSTMVKNMFLKCATALDPRHKSLKCIPAGERAQVWTHLKTLTTLAIALPLDRGSDNDDDGPALVNAKRTKFMYASSSEEDEDTAQPASTLIEATQLIEGYRALSPPDDDCDPLKWWKLHQATYVPLAKLAMKYLCCPGTSVPSERLFSTAGNIISKKRSCLLPENANKLICLSSWLKDC